jgi:glycosyltransferase involved in cell wall biosynthesis
MKSLPAAARCDVVIPAHNAQRYIGEAIRSVLDQNFAVGQIIVVDDASTDHTPSEVAAFGSIVRVVKGKCGSAGAARNLGVGNSSGEFIAFLDADDICLPGRLRLQAESLTAHPEAVMVFCDAEYINSAGQSTKRQFTFPEFRSGVFLGQLFERNRILTTSVAMVRRCAFESAGGFDEHLIYSEDYDLWIRLARQGGGVEHIPKSLVGYRLHDANMTASRGASQRWEAETLRKYALAEIRDALAAVYNDSAKTDLKMSLVLFRMEIYAEGEKLLHSVEPQAEDRALRNFVLGNFALKRNDEHSAEENYRLALECNPESAECHNNLGVVVAGQGREREAMQHFLRAATLWPGYSDPNHNAEALRLGRTSELRYTLVPLRPVLRPDSFDKSIYRDPEKFVAPLEEPEKSKLTPPIRRSV